MPSDAETGAAEPGSPAIGVSRDGLLTIAYITDPNDVRAAHQVLDWLEATGGPLNVFTPDRVRDYAPLGNASPAGHDRIIRRLAAALAKIAAPPAVAVAGPAARTACDAFVTGGTYTLAYRTGRRTVAARFLRWLDDAGVPLAAASPKRVEDFLADCDLATASEQSYRTILTALLTLLHAHGVTGNPPPDHPRPRPGTAPDSPDEIAADWFTHANPAERQAIVDAAAWAVTAHVIQEFSGVVTRPFDVERADAVLSVGRQHGVEPYSWLPPAEEEGPAEDAAPTPPAAEPGAAP